MQTKSILEIASDLDRLKTLGQKNGFALSDLSGGTISLSNIGIIGGTTLHPVLVSTEVCIAALGKIQSLPRYNEDGELQRKELMCISFSADHRVVDGATVARFCSRLKAFVETPGVFLAGLK